MARSLIRTEDISSNSSRILEDAAKIFSFTPHWLQALARSPALLEGFWGFFASVMNSPHIPKDTKLMIALDVASTDGCTACIGGYRSMIRQAGFSEQLIDDIEGKVASPLMDEGTQTILVFSYALTKDPHDLTQTTVESLRKKVTDEELIETVSVVNLFRSILETIHGLALHEYDNIDAHKKTEP